MNSMTKCIPVCKNTTGNHEQDAEEESSASEGERETVGKPTGKEAVGKATWKTPDTQNVWDVTEIVTGKRTMEEIPLSTQEQVLWCLSPERREVTGESSSCMGRVWQQMSHPQIMQVIKRMRKMKIIHQRSTARMTKWNSSNNSKILWMKQLNDCLTSQRENTLAEKINLNCTWNRESARKSHARKRKCFHP